MPGFLADENIDPLVIRLVRAAAPSADIVTAREAGLERTADPEVLAWAAAARRVVITHDRRTMVPFAWQRVSAALPMPGLVYIRQRASVATTVEAITVVVEAGTVEDFENKVLHLA